MNNTKITDTSDTRYYRLANFLVFAILAAFGIFRIINAIAVGEYRHVLILLISCTFLVTVLILILHTRQGFLNAPLLLPLLLYATYLISSFIMKSFTYFFTIHFAISCIVTVYFNRGKLGWFILISGAVNLVIIALGLPLTSSGRPDPPFTEVIVNSVLMFSGSILLYMIAVFATSKTNKAIKAMDSFATLMETTSNWLALVDDMNRVTYISKLLADYAHLEQPELCAGRPVLDLFADPDVKYLIGVLLERHSSYSAIHQITVDGEVRHFQVFTREMSGKTAGLYIRMNDITDIVKVKEAAEEARQVAEASNKTKSDFLATMSHEIRTPMNTIIGMSDLMPMDNLTTLQRDYFNDIRKMGKSLLTIINDILDFSKIEAGKLELVPVHFDLYALFDNIFSMSRFLAEGKGLHWNARRDYGLPQYLYGDEIRIRQVLTNILNNAVKYTRAGSVSFILGSGTYGKDDPVMVTPTEYLIAVIEDTGVGIKQQDIPRLFESFQQLDAKSNRGITGTGLGLAITRQLLDLMGGHIEVKSEYGQGSCFTLYIPLVQGDPSKIEHDKTSMVTATSSVCVLVVDDMIENLTVVRGFLALRNIDVETAQSGADAIRMIEEKAKAAIGSQCPTGYDLIFMDHMMPEMDGLEATQRIRELESNWTPLGTASHPVPIIALSANAIAGVRDIFLKSGMNDFLSKPIEAFALNTILAKWLPADKITIHSFNTGSSGAMPKTFDTMSGMPNMSKAMPGISNQTPDDKSKAAPDRTEEDCWERARRAATALSSNDAALVSPGYDHSLHNELAAIPGLDVQSGVSYSGGNRETYYEVLKQFYTGLDDGVQTITEALTREDWKDYAIRLHAYKSVFATIGNKALADWALKLELAGTDAAAGMNALITAQVCRAETASFITAVRGFHDALAATSLISPKPEKKTHISVGILTEKLKALFAACVVNKAAEASRIASMLESVSGDEATDAAVTEIRGLVASTRYDDAAEKIAELRYALSGRGDAN
jgi:signal transduction histidine kinase/CheY-like chemotaxis protein/HPt (histidine-containing phosphotransfer) domain-containing protein